VVDDDKLHLGIGFGVRPAPWVLTSLEAALALPRGETNRTSENTAGEVLVCARFGGGAAAGSAGGGTAVTPGYGVPIYRSFVGASYQYKLDALSSFIDTLEQSDEMVGISGKDVRIALKGTGFTPRNIVIKEGATVTWTNMDNTSHTISDFSGSLIFPEMLPGESVSHHFNTPGRYDYWSEEKRVLTGIVEVTPKDEKPRRIKKLVPNVSQEPFEKSTKAPSESGTEKADEPTQTEQIAPDDK